MKRILPFLTLLLISISLDAQQNLAYFLTDPTLSPDGKLIVFVYENDLWKVESTGGTAYRITAMNGPESTPRFSPDGKWIAFSSAQNGNADVYVMPVEGGEIKQLTFHDANDYVDSWSWNSQTIYFTSNRYNNFSAYTISLNGGTPARLFGENYFNTTHHVVESPTESAYFFTDSWESYLFPHRKRYIGENNPDIRYYNSSTNEYKDLTDYNGKDLWPTIDQKGNLYIASDEANKVYNLYSLTGGVKKQLTSFNTAIGRPQVSASGNKIVFTKDYQVCIYDVISNSTIIPDIKIFKNETLQTEKSFKTAGEISDFDVSADNKKIAFVSRGRLFVSDIEGKFIREINTLSTERVIEVKWLSDNSNLIFIRSNKGWFNIFTISAEKNEPEKQLTNTDKTDRFIELSPKKDKAVYISGNNNINLIDLKTNIVKTIVTDEFWFRGDRPRFSPDGNFIVYTAFRNFEPDVFIYDFKLNKTSIVTNTGVPEADPFWSPDGKYLYISANRYNPGYPRGEGETKLYRIPLYRFASEFKSDEYNNLFKPEKKKDTLLVDIKFEFEQIEERWENLKFDGGNQEAPNVFYEKGKTFVLFNSYVGYNNSTFWKMELNAFEKPKTEKLFDKAFSSISKSKDKYYALIEGDIYEVKPKDNKVDKIKIDYTFSKNLQNEFVQMFYENWSALAENFYDENYHGINWPETKKQYETYLPYVRNRENLRTLQNDLLGELNASHLDFRTQGDEQKTFYKLQTLSTGIIFDENSPYIVKRLVQKSPVDVLDNKIQTGDELIAVNNTLIDKKFNREFYFTLPELLDEISLKFKRKDLTYEVKLHPISAGTFNNLLYDEWILNNQKVVDKLSQKQIAYVYMKDMGTGSLNDFLIDMTTEAMHKDALILDLRYNRGGNVHDDVIKFLSQQPYLEWKYRNGKLSPQPNFAPAAKPIVLLINEQSLSDAEMTAAGFKQLKLGTIIGTETYRWIIFTSARQLVDGSYTRLPAWGCYTLDGQNLEKTGVKPDIYIKNTFIDRFNNNDPQLEKAIDEIIKQLSN
ncbi:MAG: peptidase S41 [Bacteroidetes bacterium GWF2_33_16]|nr:MAG: peptidase S41 [Bacteroidetes bacterium GWE2_32_14]OFY05929.1 MAG: peptidase S41 [Bacteroidetes bacterium GWF2_33_16]